MGITFQTVTFADEPPQLAQIAEAMRQLCGLTISVEVLRARAAPM